MDCSKLVTVVITTFKRPPDVVKRALDSVLRQTYTNIEVIIVDDSPIDYKFRAQVGRLINEYINKGINLKYYKHIRNLGACAARNTGLKNANGEYINFLDDDDEFVDNKIEKQIEVLNANTDLAFVYCRCFLLNEETGTLVENPEKMYKGDVFHILLSNNFIGTSSFPLIRTEYLKKENGFDVGLPASQDYDMWLRLCKNYNVDFVDLPLVIYHNHKGEQISKNPKKKIEGLEKIYSKHEQFINSDKQLWSTYHLKLTFEYARDKQFKKALWIWVACVKHYPTNIKVNLIYLINIIRTSIRSYKNA